MVCTGGCLDGIMMIDSKLLEERLISHDSVIGGNNVSTCAIKFSRFMKALNEKADETSALDELTREILLYQLDASRTEKTDYSQDILEYQILESEVDQQILLNQTLIGDYTKELKQEQQIRKFKEECELLAKLVNQYPSRQSMNKEIEKLKSSISLLEQQTSIVETRIQRTSNQTQLLVQSIREILNGLKADEESDQLHLQMENSAFDDEDKEDDDVDERHIREERTEPSKKPRLEFTENEQDSEETKDVEKEEVGNVEDGEVISDAGEVVQEISTTS